MRALILSCNTGEGHNAAGRAVLEELKLRGIDCEMRDALAFGGEKVSRFITSAMTGVTVKYPWVFALGYKAGERISSDRHKSIIYLANSGYAEALKSYIEGQGFDTVITPHLFAGEALTYIRRNLGGNFRYYAVATDYTITPFWEETEMDAFFIPHAELMDEFACKGVPREKLFPFGIPVSGRFCVDVEKRAARRQLGLPEEGRVYLLMTGGAGFGDLSQLIELLIRHDPQASRIVVLAGRNTALKKRLEAEFSGYTMLSVMDYTRQVPLYMDAADVLLTKPGGLTITEAAVKGVPMVLTAPIPGCETLNRDFFLKRHIALSGANAQEIARQAVELAGNYPLEQLMTFTQHQVINRRAAKSICDAITAWAR